MIRCSVFKAAIAMSLLTNLALKVASFTDVSCLNNNNNNNKRTTCLVLSASEKIDVFVHSVFSGLILTPGVPISAQYSGFCYFKPK